jgi:hypothetical protein
LSSSAAAAARVLCPSPWQVITRTVASSTSTNPQRVNFRASASQASIRSYYLAALSRLYEALVAPDSAGVAANLGVQRPYYGARSRFAAGSAGMSPR